MFFGALVLVARVSAQESIVGGTQPGELAIPLEPPEYCVECHRGFADSPWEAWEGTMMANAMRDPLFLAALTIAEQDITGIGDFCLRCHTPVGWLEGRCVPGDGSMLIASDYEGISCDVCHRMTYPEDGVNLIGNARYTIHASPDKRGALGSTYASHGTAVEPLVSSAELCGTCHEVSNPLFQDFPIERTYSEYAASAWPAEGKTCQDCHMAEAKGVAATEPGLPERQLHVHRFIGGNAWIPEVLAGEYPELGRDAAFRQVSRDARAHLTKAATLEVVVPAAVTAGIAAEIGVRVTNETGHKLPTGYPEGRRAWLEVVITDALGVEVFRSGTYDPATATIAADPQLRTYQALLGSDGVQSYHMVEQDQILEDGRIPPKGFRPTADIAPVGRTFETLADGSLANWDLAPYAVLVPSQATGPLSIEATLWYQTTTRAFVEFLRDENRTDSRGDEMYALWEKYGEAPPEFLASATGTVPVNQPLPPDEGDDGDRRGCGCTSGGPPAAGLVALGFAANTRRRTRRPGCATS